MAKRVSSSDDSAGESLISLYHAMRRRLDQALAEHAMSVSRLKLLLLLEADGPARMSTIASELDLAVRSTMDAVASLEREGMVTRSDDPTDRRAVLAAITPSGRAAMRKALRAKDRVLEDTFAVLSGAERDQLIGLVARVRTSLAR